MAIKHIAKKYEYIGLSTDDKSIIETEGAEIFYADTGLTERYYNGTWIPAPSPTTVIGDGENTADIIETNGNMGLVVISPNHNSTLNTSSTPLDGDGVFTGTGEDTTNYADLIITVKSDQASATDGLEIQFSPDNVNWNTTDNYTIAANTCKTFSVGCIGKYFRVKYTNGAVAQTSFSLCTRMNTTSSKSSSHRIDESISGEDDAELVKSVITGKRADGQFDNVSLTNGSNMKISLEELEGGISSNDNSQLNVTLFTEAGTPVDNTESIIAIENVVEGAKEDITNGFKVINSDHAGIHYGLTYSASDYFTLTDSAIKRFSFVTSSTLFTHFKNINYNVLGGSVSLKIIKDATVTVGAGNTLAPQNLNHNSSNTADAVITEDSTYTGGTIWEYIVALADSTNKTVGTGNIKTSDNEEHIMKDGQEEYIFEFENLTSDNVDVYFRALFYEEPQGLTVLGG
jgi:hypothetical protein